MEANHNDTLRSENSRQEAYVRFINLTQRKVEVVWINFTGGYVRYETLDKGGFFDVNTYTRHPWIAIDHDTRDRLHINKDFIYYPQTVREYLLSKRPDLSLPENLPPKRIQAVITIPLYSLKYCSLLTVRNLIQNPDSVDDLELPKNLKSDLKRIIVQRNNQIPF